MRYPSMLFQGDRDANDVCAYMYNELELAL